MSEKTQEEDGYQSIMRFRIKDTRLDMAGAFFGWIDEWCEENGFGKALICNDPEGFTVVWAKTKRGSIK